MSKWQIESKAGLMYGVYEGETAEDAFQAMVEDGGEGVDDDGNATAGTSADWIITEVQ